MITKVQNTSKQQSFTANWSDARKVIASLPEKHDFFSGLNYTLDNKTVSTKNVLLARLDKAVDYVKNTLKENKTLNLAMPDFKNIYKNPKKFWRGLKEQYLLGSLELPYAHRQDYKFKRTVIENDKAGVKKLSIYEKDSLNDVANILLKRGKALAKELRKAGLENPKEIVI